MYARAFTSKSARVCLCIVSEASAPRDSNPSTSECVWLERRRRSLASISSDSPRPSSNPSISHYLTPHYLTHTYTHTQGQQACDLPEHQSQPAHSSAAESTSNRTQDSIISYCLKSAVILSAFLLLSSESSSPCYIISAAWFGEVCHSSPAAGGMRGWTVIAICRVKLLQWFYFYSALRRVLFVHLLAGPPLSSSLNMSTNSRLNYAYIKLHQQQQTIFCSLLA